MAQIKISCQKVLKACDKILEHMNQPRTSYKMTDPNDQDCYSDDDVTAIKELAEYGIKYNFDNCERLHGYNPAFSKNEKICEFYSEIWIDHKEYQLLKDYL